MNFKKKGREYLKNSPIRSTDLKTIAKSPKRFLYERLLGNGIKVTPSIEKGRNIHKYFLEKEGFEKEYEVLDVKMITAKIKTKYEGTDLIPIRRCEVEEFEEMKDAYKEKEKPHGIDLFSLGTTYEKQINWAETIEKKKIYCTARLDAFYQKEIEGGIKHVIIDLKTTADAKEKPFLTSAHKLKYPIQMAHYLQGYCKVFNVHPREVVFALVAIETSPPYNHNVFMADGDDWYINKGEEERQEAICTLLGCCTSGEFPEGRDYPEQTIELEAPTFLK